jgi:Fe-Mn family superoxide dismutase
MIIALPQLPYSTNALEPVISQKTLELHYGKHHRNYVEKTNQLIANSDYEGKSLEEIVLTSVTSNRTLYNNAAQAWNHAFYWKCLTPSRPEPSQALVDALNKNFGSIGDFQTAFTKLAASLFGSGWAWLVRDSNGALKLRATSNAGNPMTKGEIPLFTCDVWEHAYYLDYQNERSRYLNNYWKIANWTFVASNLADAPATSIKPRDERPEIRGGEATRLSH